MKLAGKVALVTGGARGIGKAISERLASDGATIAIADINLEVAEATAKELNSNGFKAKAYAMNVVNSEDVTAKVKEIVKDFGSLDILVNNAGITKDGLLMRMKDDQWDAVIAVNLKGTFNCTKAVARPMVKAKQGKIINIASVVGVMGNAGQANYAASKAGVIGLTKTTAKELAGKNINANAVAPGFIQTEMTKVLSDEATNYFMDNTPLKRAGTPKDVANVVAFLAGPDSDFVTVQVINIDGGLVM